MFVKLSCKIADRLEHCGIISKSNRTLYEYGLRQMFATILNILTAFVNKKLSHLANKKVSQL